MSTTSPALLSEHYYQTQVRDAAGALIFNGFICALGTADAFRQAARKWPGCAIRIEGKDAPASKHVGAKNLSPATVKGGTQP